MAITLSPATVAAIKALATKENSTVPFEGSVLIVTVPVASVPGLAADIAAVIPNSTKGYAIASLSEGSNFAYLEASTEEAEGVMLEMSYHAVEAEYC